MRKKYVTDLKDKDKLAKTIYNENGHVLLNSGIEFNGTYISKISKLGLNHVYIEDEISQEIEIEDFLSDKIRAKCRVEIKNTINNIITGKPEDFNKIIDCAELILDDIMTNKFVIYNIEDTRFDNDTIAYHTINVSALIAMAGKNMGYNYLRLKDIVVGAVLHDIGKAWVLKEKGCNLKDLPNLNKNILKEHPKKGYELLNQQWAFSSTSKVMVLMHHENCDGSGYPMQLKKKDINEAARLLSVCNAFDNIVNGEEGYGKKTNFHQAKERLHSMANVFDQEVVDILDKFIPDYPTGTIIKLSTGEKAIVTKQNFTNLSRPVVRLIDSEADNELKDIDLNANKNIMIITI